MPSLRKKKSSVEFCRVLLVSWGSFTLCEGFTKERSGFTFNTYLSQLPPPGSGYLGPEDEISTLPETYEPMMEFPGTMRPGRTPENMPYHDLPLDDGSPDPIPWPHFQQIEWHHRWRPPHPHPIPMEVFIEMQVRWATAEDEAEMRASSRRNVRDGREIAEQERKQTLIVDDEDDDPEDGDRPVDLGDGMFGSLGTTDLMREPITDDDDDATEESQDDDDLDDFLLDLGLNTDDKDDIFTDKPSSPPTDDGTSNLLDAMTSMIDEEEAGGGESDKSADLDLDLGLLDMSTDGKVDITVDSDNAEVDEEDAIAALSEDEDLDIDLDDDEDLSSDGGMTMVPLEDFGDDSLMDEEDAFDDGGFDYDGGDGGDGGDVW